MDNKELAGAYRQFFKSALGKDLTERLDRLYNTELDKATTAEKEASWSMVNRAGGIDAVRSELKRVQSIDMKGGGRK